MILYLNQPIEINGRTVIFIRDEAGDLGRITDNLADYIPIHVDGTNSINLSFSQKELISIRKIHPQIPIYGIWQYIISNNLIDCDDDKNSSYYLPLESGTDKGLILFKNEAISTERNNFISDLVVNGISDYAGYIKDLEIKKILLKDEKLRFPESPLLARKEITISQ